MSFSLTTPQILARTKTVTRRLGWQFLQPGDLVQAVEKGMGLRKGERVKRLAVLRIKNVRREPLYFIHFRHIHDTALEGFPLMTNEEFIKFFCRSHKGCTPVTVITRIAFEYVDEA
jgi:hypothetical protein